MNYTEEEKRLALHLCELLSGEFNILTEEQVKKNPGSFLLDGQSYKSIPDLLISPKKYLIEESKFIDTVIPVEIKKFSQLETNKFEDLMFQCHSYRMSSFNDRYPKLSLYYIDNYFEYREENTHLVYDYEAAKKSANPHHYTKMHIRDKIKIETLFGRFGIGELVTTDQDYEFRLKRQLLFRKKGSEIVFKPLILNYWWGSKGTRKNHSC